MFYTVFMQRLVFISILVVAINVAICCKSNRLSLYRGDTHGDKREASSCCITSRLVDDMITMCAAKHGVMNQVFVVTGDSRHERISQCFTFTIAQEGN